MESIKLGRTILGGSWELCNDDSALRRPHWGTILWFLMMLMVLPMLGRGPFFSDIPAPTVMILVTLVVHWVYGTILGAVAGAHRLR